MNKTDSSSQKFSKFLLTGVFAGIVATVISLVFNILYRDATGFSLSGIVNVSTLIFGVNILFVLVGLCYFIFLKLFRKGDLLFIFSFALLTAFCIWKARSVHRTDDFALNCQFRNLLTGIILIMGISADFFVPLLFHSAKFEEHVL